MRSVAVLVFLGTSLVAVLGATGSAVALPVGAFITGAIAFGSGAVLAVLGWSGRRQARFRVLLGLALCVWAVGQFVQGVYAIVAAPSFPLPGDLVSFVAAPIAVAGVLAIPRRQTPQWPGLRLGLDSALLGVALAFLAWRLRFHAPFLDRPFDVTEATAAVVLVADVTVVCLGVLLWLRDLDRDIGIVALGTACYSAGDLVTLYALLQSGPIWPWQGAVLWCLAWPLIAGGLLRHRAPGGLRRDSVDPDARVVTTTTVLAVAFVAVGLLTMIVRGETDLVSLWFVVVAVLVLGLRETLNARMRSALLRSLQVEATTDPLTGLSNRRVLAQRIGAAPPGVPHSLLRVDLEGFKEVNDLFGHATGDRLLQAVGRRIRVLAPEHAVVSRIGGDDFCLLVEDDAEAARRLAERLVEAVRGVRVHAGGRPVGVTASVGVAAVRPRRLHAARDGGADDGRADGGVQDDPLGPLSGADAALQRAQSLGREQVVVYEAEFARSRRRRLGVEDRLRRAVADGGLTVAFQPLVDLQDGDAVVGAEALARWSDPVLGDVGPAEFIPVAEQTGLVVGLGEHVLETTLAEAASAGFVELGLRISVNVSPLQLRVPGFDDVVRGALARHDVPAHLLVLEVTESLLVDESGAGVEVLRRLAESGVQIAIDDFGSGYSALGYLSRLPAGVLKMDRSLTPSLTVSEPARAVVRAVLDVGRGLGLSVVLEGIETAELADLARRMGVGYGQGAWFGSAMSASCVVSLAGRRAESAMPPAG